MALIAISLGSNIVAKNMNGRRDTLQQAALCLFKNRDIGEITKVAASSFYETEAVGYKDQPDFINQVILAKSNIEPLSLLDIMQKIEQDFGRERIVDKGPRTLDLDLLLFENRIIKHPRLIVPHVEMTNRRFVLLPLCEIASDMIEPVSLKTINELLEECKDMSTVKKVEKL